MIILTCLGFAVKFFVGLPFKRMELSLSGSGFTGLDFVLNVIDEVCGWQALMAWSGIFTSMRFFSVIGHIYAVFTAVQAKTFLLFSVLQFRVCLPERSKVGCSGSSVVGGLVQAIAPFLFADFCSISPFLQT
ncbi:MAG: hypothetical protein OXL96_05315 [Candidatus Poribacteria bacterium]|nr:hypothetical protein [Candidatus Poribacteria bacterium]